MKDGAYKLEINADVLSLIIPGQNSCILQGDIHSLTMKMQKKSYQVTLCCILVKTNIHYA
jgi:hypothetical protein